MSYRELFRKENDHIRERYDLVCERIADISRDHSVHMQYEDYFVRTAVFILKTEGMGMALERDELVDADIQVLSEINRKLYMDIFPENYAHSYGNPRYAAAVLGREYGRYLSALYSEIRQMIDYAWECRRVAMTMCMELFVEIYNIFEEERHPKARRIRQAIYWYISDYCDMMLPYRMRELYDPSLDFLTRIVMTEDFSDLRYLYRYGAFISPHEVMLAEKMQKESREALEKRAQMLVADFLAKSMTENGKLSENSCTVNLYFPIGMERLVRAVVYELEKYSIVPLMHHAANQILCRTPEADAAQPDGEAGLQPDDTGGAEADCRGCLQSEWDSNMRNVISRSPNRAYDADHLNDAALFMDKALVQRRQAVEKAAEGEMQQLRERFLGSLYVY